MRKHRWTSRLLAVLVAVAPFAVARPASALVPAYTVKLPGVVPLVTLLASQPAALTADAMGAPSQLPVKTDTLLVNSAERVYAAKRNIKLKPGGMSAQSQPPECEDYGAHGWFYDVTGSKTFQFVQKNNESRALANDSDGSLSFSVTSSSGGSVTIGADGGVEVQASVIVASVGAKFGLNLSGTISWGHSVTTTVSVPPHKRVVASWGVSRVVTTGHYYYKNSYCEVTIDKGVVQTATPMSWTVWARNY